jgi:hypothetical protein
MNSESNSSNEIISDKSNSEISSSSDLDSEKYKENELFENMVFNKYFSSNIFTKYDDEIKKTSKNQSKLDKSIILNNYNQLVQNLNNGEYIYNKIFESNPKLCSDPNCLEKKLCKKQCYKNSMYKCLRNTNRGIKSIYHLIFKLIMYNPKFRNFCKCCEDKEQSDYISGLDKNFIEKNENIVDGIKTRLEPKILLDLQINYLLNKFMNVIGVLPCECRFRKKYDKFYKDNYLNFKETIKIYTRTIPNVIKLLKFSYDIKDNHEELRLIKDSRCIHEDIRFNNITYCKKKNYQDVSNKTINEIIMNIDILNEWVLESIKIGIHMYNQQSLEYLIYTMRKNSFNNLIKNFDRIYSISNDLLDLNYVSNKKNLFICIQEKSINIPENILNNFITMIKNQYMTRNKKYYEKYNINDIFINFVIESFKKSNIKLGLEFLKHVNNLTYKKDYDIKLEYIFEIILQEPSIDIKTKVSYIKLINKNKINVIKYDIVNQLISNDLGDKIIIEFNKDENSLFNLDHYKNKEYVINIIKKCIHNIKVNILDYLLYNLHTFILQNKIEPVFLYILSINKDYKFEYIYIELLKTILKYNHNVNINLDIEEINENISIINYCVLNSYYQTAKFLLDYDVEYEKDILFKCIDKKNHIILGYLIEKNCEIIKVVKNNFTLITYLFDKADKNDYETDVLMRFLLKIIKPIVENKIDDQVINFQDSKNELFGFKVLNSKLGQKNKINLFSILKDNINSLEINKYERNNICIYNFPLIMYSVLLNEYEITYLLLNYLFKNVMIKKNIIVSTCTFFDYTHTSSKININFIPIVFKFLQDNYDLNTDIKTNEILDELKYTQNKVVLETDITIIKIYFILVKMIIANISFRLKDLLTINNKLVSKNPIQKYKQNDTTSDNNINKFVLNKYKKESKIIFNQSTNDNLITNLNFKNKFKDNFKDNYGPNGYAELSVDTLNNNILETETNDENFSSKNIWLNSNTNLSKGKINKKINERYNNITSKVGDDSSISESEICFEK